MSDIAPQNVSVNLPCLYSFSSFWLELLFCYNSFANKILLFSSCTGSFFPKAVVHYTVLKLNSLDMFCAWMLIKVWYRLYYPNQMLLLFVDFKDSYNFYLTGSNRSGWHTCTFLVYPGIRHKSSDFSQTNKNGGVI